MALIMGLEGVRGNRLMGVRGMGLIPPARATTLAGLYGTLDVVKRHPLLILAGLVFGGYWATRHAEGKGLVSSAAEPAAAAGAGKGQGQGHGHQ